MLISIFYCSHQQAGLAQSVERQALNLMVEGSSPSFGVFLFSADILALSHIIHFGWSIASLLFVELPCRLWSDAANIAKQ